MSDDPDRTEGVEFGDIESVLQELGYPVTAQEIVSQHGDRELGRTNADPISLEELLSPMGETEFQSAEDLKTMLLGQMPEASTGRTGYSDRGGSLPAETDAAEAAGDDTSADHQDGAATDRDRTEQES